MALIVWGENNDIWVTAQLSPEKSSFKITHAAHFVFFCFSFFYILCSNPVRWVVCFGWCSSLFQFLFVEPLSQWCCLMAWSQMIHSWKLKASPLGSEPFRNDEMHTRGCVELRRSFLPAHFLRTFSLRKVFRCYKRHTPPEQFLTQSCHLT